MHRLVNMVLRIVMRRIVGGAANRGTGGSKPRRAASSGQLRRNLRMIRRMVRF